VISSPEIEKILEFISVNRLDGATSLAGRGLDALDALARCLPPASAGREARALAARIDALRPSMASVGVQAALAVARAESLAAQGMPWSRALAEAVLKERETLGQADDAIAAIAAQHLGRGGAVVSCSWSVTALRAIVALKPALVRIGHGWPLGDGLRSAAWLAARGLKAEVLPDGCLAAAVDGARIVLVGADHVLADGSIVNRASTCLLALAARHADVPFFAACQRIKLAGRVSPQIEELGGALGDLPDGVSCRAPLFDVTPAHLVTSVITESGVLSTAEAGEIGRSIDAVRRRILA
jgi:translation initiation factor 2B subunit (eIF-2B alpha/beta/delta family)